MNYLFWLSIALMAYIYLGYPLLIALWGFLCPRPVKRGRVDDAVSLVLAVRNEEKLIGRKLDNLLEIADPRLKEIWVVSDGSTDRTVEIAESYALRDSRIHIQALPEPVGKSGAISRVVPQCKGALVFFQDVRQRLDPEAMTLLLESFADPEVGVVTGELMLEERSESGGVSSSYWNIEKWIRRMESRVHSIPGATGAIYMIRKSTSQPIPDDLLLDDVAIPMNAVMQGYRCVMDNRAKAYDQVADANAEMKRKRRTITGMLQLIDRYPRLLNPFYNPIWWQFASHKVMRLTLPLLWIAGMISGIILISRGLAYLLFVSASIWVMTMGIVGGILSVKTKCPRCLRICFLVIWLNVSVVVAIACYLRSKGSVRWS